MNLNIPCITTRDFFYLVKDLSARSCQKFRVPAVLNANTIGDHFFINTATLSQPIEIQALTTQIVLH